jgi:hypothetical protein
MLRMVVAIVGASVAVAGTDVVVELLRSAADRFDLSLTVHAGSEIVTIAISTIAILVTADLAVG